MDDSTSPIEAGLDWAVDFDKTNFVGKDRSVQEKTNGVTRRLAGFELIERGIPRHGFEVEKNGRTIGVVTSGSFAPTLKKNIGMAYIPLEESVIGNELEIVIRTQRIKARVAELPFYRRKIER